MTTEQIITPDDGSDVDPHPHDATEISGEATLITLRVNRLLAGTINGKEIIVAGGTDGILRSDNFSSGSDGWQVLGDGTAEFNDVTVRGTIIAGAGSDVGFDDVSAGSNTAALVIGAGGDMQSSNFATGSTGWQIDGDGSAEFQNVTVRGSINADDLDAGTLDVDRIAAGTLTAEKFIIGSRDNLLEDPGFESGSLHPASVQDDGGGDGWTINTAASRSGGASLRYGVGAQSTGAFHRVMGVDMDDNPQVSEGDSIYFSAFARRAGGGTSHDASLTFLWRDENGAGLGTVTSTATTLTGSTWSLLEHEATAPAGVAYVAFSLNVSTTGDSDAVHFDDLYARRQVGAVILEADLQSDNFSSGSAGWQIERDTGNAEFNDVTVRGEVLASKFTSASSGNRIEIDPGALGAETIRWADNAGTTGRIVNDGTNFTIRAADNLRLESDTDTVISFAIADQTTSSSANMRIDATTAQIFRSTSSLAYKPGWQFADLHTLAARPLPNPITWGAEGHRFLGFGAEHVHETTPESYQDDGENYDLRSVVAQLVARELERE